MNEILTVVMLALLGITLATITILAFGHLIIVMREAYIDLAHEWKKAWGRKV